MSNKSYSDIARHIKMGAAAAINGGWRSNNGVCHYLAQLDNERYYEESYNMMRYLIGDLLYFKGLGFPGSFSDKRRALCKKLAGLSLRTLRRYAAQMDKARMASKYANDPVKAFAFLKD